MLVIQLLLIRSTAYKKIASVQMLRKSLEEERSNRSQVEQELEKETIASSLQIEKLEKKLKHEKANNEELLVQKRTAEGQVTKISTFLYKSLHFEYAEELCEKKEQDKLSMLIGNPEIKREVHKNF